jgi:hypothetical protein
MGLSRLDARRLPTHYKSRERISGGGVVGGRRRDGVRTFEAEADS